MHNKPGYRKLEKKNFKNNKTRKQKRMNTTSEILEFDGAIIDAKLLNGDMTEIQDISITDKITETDFNYNQKSNNQEIEDTLFLMDFF